MKVLFFNNIVSIKIGIENENFANSTTISSDDGTIVAKKKNRSEFMGMFKLSVEDDPVVVRNLIIGNLFIVNSVFCIIFNLINFIELRPETALKLLPGLPAYILFMCIRYYDFSKEEKRVSILLLC